MALNPNGGDHIFVNVIRAMNFTHTGTVNVMPTIINNHYNLSFRGSDDAGSDDSYPGHPPATGGPGGSNDPSNGPPSGHDVMITDGSHGGSAGDGGGHDPRHSNDSVPVPDAEESDRPRRKVSDALSLTPATENPSKRPRKDKTKKSKTSKHSTETCTASSCSIPMFMTSSSSRPQFRRLKRFDESVFQTFNLDVDEAQK